MNIIELYSLLVIEGGINPEYFMDKMQMYELEPLLSNIFKKNKDGWEQTRMIAYITAQANSSKKLKPTDILRFNWDKEDGKDTFISSDEITRLREKSKQFLNTL